MSLAWLRRAGVRLAAAAERLTGSDDRAALLLVGGGFVVAIAAVVAFHALASEVTARETQAFDEAVLRSIAEAKARLAPRAREVLDSTVTDLSALGSPLVLALLAIVSTGYLALARRRGEALLAAIVAVGAGAINFSLKSFFARPRPETATGVAALSPSFPSGHALASMAIYVAIGVMVARTAPTWRARIFVMTFAVVASILVALSRIYLGVHYPTDILGGALVGLAWALVILAAAEVYRMRRRRSGEARTAI